MSTLEVVARNFSANHENRIHSDEIARNYGFRGALVPGVAVFGHLSRPLAERFGERWLGHSVNDTRFFKPAYDGDRLTISTAELEEVIQVRAHDQAGTLLAELNARLPETLPDLHDRTVLDQPALDAPREQISWEAIRIGQPFPEWHVQITTDENQRYAEEVGDTLAIYRHFAHPHWLLSLANQALTRRYIMPAWLHVGSDICFRKPVRVGDTLGIRAVPVEKWERKGHQFVKIYLAYHRLEVLTTEVLHTAIFRIAE